MSMFTKSQKVILSLKVIINFIEILLRRIFRNKTKTFKTVVISLFEERNVLVDKQPL